MSNLRDNSKHNPNPKLLPQTQP